MNFGLAFASSVGTGMDSALEICRAAEKLGFDSVWGGEHVIRPDAISSPYPYAEDGQMPGEAETAIPDPLIWLAYVAAAAPSLRLGTCILILPQRNPVLLAKELATLDQLSGGRVELGIGVGWMREEFEALGIPWERRGARTDEYIHAMRALWSGPHAEYHGEFVEFPPATCSPRPIQDPLPIIVGGDSPAAVRRAVRLGDGYFPGTVDTPRLEALKIELVRTAERESRDPARISLHAIFGPQMADPVAGAEAFARLGIDRVMVPAFFFMGPEGLDNLATFAEQVVHPLSTHPTPPAS